MFLQLLMLALPLGLVSASNCTSSSCHFLPSINATTSNYPGSSVESTSALYNLNSLSAVPVASICNSPNATQELTCARGYIDAIDEQLAYLYARRLGYAAVAGAAKFRSNTSLNDPTRNSAVAEAMAQLVMKFGGSGEAGSILGGEGCMIYASLTYEVSKIQEDCDPSYVGNATRVCTSG